MKPIAIALLFAASTCAAETIGVHIGSQHYPQKQYDNFNPGAYVRFDNGATFGAYHNSYGRTSAYAAYTHEWGYFALTGGAITGYPYPLFVAPSVKLPINDTVAARIVVLPKFEKGGSTVVHLALEFKL